MSNIVNTIGALLVGSWFSIAMWGAMSYQAYRFLRRGAKLGRRSNLRMMVGALWVLDTLHIVFAAHAIYWYLILQEASAEARERIIWSLPTTIAITAAINWIVQMFFAQRIWILGKGMSSKSHVVITILIVIGCTARLVFGSVTTAKAIIVGQFAIFQHFVRFLVTTGLALSVFTDFLITGTLVVWLMRNKTGLATDSLIDKVLSWTIQTGIVTTFFGTLSMVLAIVMPRNLTWLGSHMIISKLYTTMTIAHLNSRESAREERARQSESGVHYHPRFGAARDTLRELTTFNANHQVSVHVQREVFVEANSEDNSAKVDDGSSAAQSPEYKPSKPLPYQDDYYKYNA